MAAQIVKIVPKMPGAAIPPDSVGWYVTGRYLTVGRSGDRTLVSGML